MAEIDLVELGSRLQRIETDIESIRRDNSQSANKPSYSDSLLEKISKVPFLGEPIAALGPHIFSTTATLVALGIVIVAWLFITLLGITTAINWAHKNVFGTHGAISAEYYDQKSMKLLGHEDKIDEDSLYSLIYEDISEVLSTRTQLISSISSGTFIFENRLGNPHWQEDSIPVYFSATRNEAVWFYVRFSLPGDELSFINLGVENAMSLSDMFEFRGTHSPEIEDNIVKIDTYSKQGGFYEQELDSLSLSPSYDQPFHKFDLVISSEGKDFLEEYIENKQLTENLYADGYRLNADVMVVVRPK